MSVYMTRHGESVNNILNIIGGDCNITKKGEEYSKILGSYFKNKKICVWTSKLQRTKETAVNIDSPSIECENLNEIHSGDFEGMSLDTIKNNYPDLYEFRNKDKINNSYPNGESYNDLYNRVSIVLDTISKYDSDISFGARSDISFGARSDISFGARSDIILIIGHQAVCRVIYSYFTKKPLSECINVDINLHTLYELKDQEFMKVL